MRPVRFAAAVALAVALAVASGTILLAGCGGASDEDSAATDSTASEASEASTAQPDRNPGVDKYPLGEGRYVLESDPGWIHFRTAAGIACGIGPVGRIVGCDAVPPDAPPGTNQTVIEGSNRPAVYRKSESPTFTRSVDVLPEGHRLTNGATRCAVGPGETVTCETAGGAHGPHGVVCAAERRRLVVGDALFAGHVVAGGVVDAQHPRDVLRGVAGRLGRRGVVPADETWTEDGADGDDGDHRDRGDDRAPGHAREHPAHGLTLSTAPTSAPRSRTGCKHSAGADIAA
jgi:hypothetical protein